MTMYIDPKDLERFLEGKTGSYNYVEPSSCAIGQYWKSKSRHEHQWYINSGAYNTYLECLAQGSGNKSEWTFEGFLSRLRAHMASNQL